MFAVVARIEPTGRANARPMTGSVKSGESFVARARWSPNFAGLNPGYDYCPERADWNQIRHFNVVLESFPTERGVGYPF
jgi:hypothetical protein